MTGFDPYLAPPTEPGPRGRLDGLRPWLVLAILALLALAVLSMNLVQARQDPSLQIPEEVLDRAGDGPVTVPSATPTAGG